MHTLSNIQIILCMDSNKTNSNLPRLRFPEFEGEWEVKTLGEVASKVNRRNRDLEVSRILTNSATEGVIDQEEYFDRSIAVKENTDNYHIVELDDFVYNPRISASAPVGPISINKIDRGIMSPLYTIFKFHSGHIPFYEQYFKTNIWHPYLKSIANFGARFDRMNITTEGFFNMPLLLPSLAEQKKIASCLSEMDETISLQERKVEALKIHKQGLMQQLFPQNGESIPRLRFSGFTGEWEEKLFSDVCNTVTPPLKLQSRDYQKEGEYPIVDQSQDLICGWTDDESGVISDNPVIIFGDHTCVLKYIDFPFVQGADGVKILKTLEGNWPLFVYQSFLANPVNPDGYKRHFSDLKEKSFMFPKTLSEQKIIADCLATLDSIIVAESSKDEELKVYKKGLMQQLFPNSK